MADATVALLPGDAGSSDTYELVEGKTDAEAEV